MNSSSTDSYHQLCRLVHQLQEQIQKSKGLQSELEQKNIQFDLKNFEISLLDDYFSHRRHTTDNHNRLMYKVQWYIEQQQQQQKQMEKLICQQNKRQKAQDFEKTLEKQKSSNDYMFLRSNWLHYRWNVTSQTDDRMDQLSKVIAMIKGNTIKQLEKQKSNLETYENSKFQRQNMLDSKYQTQIQNLMMQKEQLLVLLQKSQTQSSEYEKQNIELKKQIQKQKLDYKDLSQKYIFLSNKNLQLRKNTVSSFQLIQQPRQAIQVYKHHQYTIHIKGNNIQQSEFRIKKSLSEVRQFLKNINDEKLNTENVLNSYNSSILLNKSLNMSESALKRVISTAKFQRPKQRAQLPRLLLKRKQIPQQCLQE